jgi:hypothetical protein
MLHCLFCYVLVCLVSHPPGPRQWHDHQVLNIPRDPMWFLGNVPGRVTRRALRIRWGTWQAQMHIACVDVVLTCYRPSGAHHVKMGSRGRVLVSLQWKHTGPLTAHFMPPPVQLDDFPRVWSRKVVGPCSIPCGVSAQAGPRGLDGRRLDCVGRTSVDDSLHMILNSFFNSEFDRIVNTFGTDPKKDAQPHGRSDSALVAGGVNSSPCFGHSFPQVVFPRDVKPLLASNEHLLYIVSLHARMSRSMIVMRRAQMLL